MLFNIRMYCDVVMFDHSDIKTNKKYKYKKKQNTNVIFLYKLTSVTFFRKLLSVTSSNLVPFAQTTTFVTFLNKT